MTQDIKHVDDENFQTETSQGVVLIDFYADWCGPCKTIAPIIEQLAAENAGKVKVVKIDVDKAQTATAAFTILSIPTLVLLKDGKEVRRFIGVTMKAELQEALNKQV